MYINDFVLVFMFGGMYGLYWDLVKDNKILAREIVDLQNQLKTKNII